MDSRPPPAAESRFVPTAHAASALHRQALCSNEQLGGSVERERKKVVSIEKRKQTRPIKETHYNVKYRRKYTCYFYLDVLRGESGQTNEATNNKKNNRGKPKQLNKHMN